MTIVDSIIAPGAPAHLIFDVRVKDIIRLYRRKSIDVTEEFQGLDRIGLYRCSKSGVKFFHPVIVGSQSFYEAIRLHERYYDLDKYEFRYASALIGPGERVLDVGCGVGNFAEAVPGATYTGLELSQSAVAEARRRRLTVYDETVEAHSRRLSGQYDVVVSFQVLEHTPQPSAFLAGCRQALRDGGLLVVSVPNDDGFEGVCVNDVLNMPPHHLSRWSEKALVGLLAEAGFVNATVHYEPLQPYHRLWFSRQFFLRALYRRLLGRAPRPVERGPLFTLLYALSQVLALLFAPALETDRKIAFGHTIIVSAKAGVVRARSGRQADDGQPMRRTAHKSADGAAGTPVGTTTDTSVGTADAGWP